jgi:zinc protease
MKIRNMIPVLALLAAAPSLGQDVRTLAQPSESPLVSFRILFHTGAASDPEGKAGAAHLTAAMLSRGGSQALSYNEIVEAMFPMATSVGSQVDKEMTVFTGETHRDNLDAYYQLLRGMLLEPGWREDDFRRLQAEQLNALRLGLRSNNEEELGKELLQTKVYGPQHPYGRPNLGTAAGIESLTLDDLKAFYAANYRRGNVVVALAGGYPQGFVERVAEDFRTLPEGAPEPMAIPAPAKAAKLRVHIVEKETRSTLISLGFPIDVNRSHPDWPALKAAQSYFGQHRSAKGRLFQRIRAVRGMNYGDYAYIEYFPGGMFQFQPEPNLARSRQIFEMWIRPVTPENGLFALHLALFELDRLVNRGLSEADFESTALFLSKFVNLLTQTQTLELGYALDSERYGLPSFNGWFKDMLAGLTAERVNQAIRRHLRSSDLDVVVITADARGFAQALRAGKKPQPVYASPPPKDVLEEDPAVTSYKLDIGSIEIIPVETVLE